MNNPYTSAVAAIENQIRDAQEEWIKHQEDCFTSQLPLNQEELPTSSPQTTHDQASLPLASASNNFVLKRLDEIEKLIRR